MNEDYYIDAYYEDRVSEHGGVFYYGDDIDSPDFVDGDETCPICESSDLTFDGNRVDCNSCGFCFGVTDL